MTDEPLPPELQRALEGLRPPVEPVGASEALLSQLHATVGVVATASASAVGAGATKAALTVPWWVPVGALVAGLGGGVAIERVRAPTPPPVAVIVLPPLPAVMVVDAGAPEETPADAGVQVVTPRRLPVAPVVVVQAGEDTLRAERLLLDASRAAQGRDPADALRQLEAHAAKYPDGQLSEERDALRIQLLSTTRPDEARTRFEAFARRYPQSPLLEVLRGLVAP